MGWLSFSAMIIAAFLELLMIADPSAAESVELLKNFFGAIGDMFLPLLLFSMFAQILDTKGGYIMNIVKFGAASLAIIVVFMVVYIRYIRGITDAINAVLDGEGFVKDILMFITEDVIPVHFLAFNVFIDFFLCSLFMFFVNYNPKKLFQGKSIIVFRLFAILPVAYEVTSIVLKYFAVHDGWLMPVYLYPFLTIKPPTTFLVFIVLALHIKRRERKFCSTGRTHEEYEKYLTMNRNSLHFSIYSAVLVIIAAIVDALALVIPSALEVVMSAQEKYGDQMQEMLEGVTEDYLANAVPTALALGFGGAVSMIMLVPILLLFSYTKKTVFKVESLNYTLDLLIPIGGVAIAAIVLIEGGYQSIVMFMSNAPQIIQNLLG